MSDPGTYALLAAGAILLLCVGLLAAWRLIPRPAAPPDVAAVWQEVQANRLAILDLSDKYETAVQRDRGRQRGKKADESSVPMTKDELRQKAIPLIQRNRGA